MDWPVSEGQIPPRPMTRFNVGDKARIACPQSPHHGKITQVVRKLELHRRRSFTGDRPWCYVWVHEVDIRPRHPDKYDIVAFMPSELVPYYDGLQRSDWSLCDWKPIKEFS